MSHNLDRRKTRGSRVRAGEYGVVLVTSGGSHGGKTGYYDDDGERGIAYVYFGAPFGEVTSIPRSRLRHTTATHLPLERWKRENPTLAQQIGVS